MKLKITHIKKERKATHAKKNGLHVLGFKFHVSRGFTLLEALVAISIISLSVAGAFTAAQSGVSASIFARDRITASYLAQESIEFVKNKRDENLLIRNSQAIPTQTWLQGISQSQGGVCGTDINNACGTDVPNGNFVSCPNGSANCLLKLDSVDSLYKHSLGTDPGTNTIFTRKVFIQETNATEAKVTVIVTWTQGNSNKSVTITENLRDWF
jgi:prepilin-type N-terminal cleavage/methylation domain-containing protein